MISSIVVSSIEDTLVLDFSKPLIYDSVSAGNLITIKGTVIEIIVTLHAKMAISL